MLSDRPLFLANDLSSICMYIFQICLCASYSVFKDTRTEEGLVPSFAITIEIMRANEMTRWSWTGSNRRPPACKAGALPTELQPHGGASVGLARLELATSPLSGVRSNHLSYRPLLELAPLCF